MYVQVSKISCLTALLLGVAVFTYSDQAFAVSCVEGAAKASDDVIVAFKADPTAFLENNQSAGTPLSNAIRSLAASDSETLDQIIELIKNASPAQKAAIGSGLARAASVCAVPQQEYAAEIQVKTAETGDLELAAAFRTASSDIATAAIDGPVTPAGDAGGSAAAVGGLESSGGGGGGNGNGSSSASGSFGSTFSSGGASGGAATVSNTSPST